jgi:DNA-binding ferritin-like protein
VSSSASDVAKLAAAIRSAIEQSAELGDPTTAELFTEI